MLRILLRFVALFIVFNALYLIVQPLDLSSLTLYNHVFPGRLRFGWANEPGTKVPLVNEFRLSRLIADHIISAPKQSNEYRVIFLGSSEVWGAPDIRPQDTMPVVIDNMGLKAPDGRIVRSYNLAYIIPDSFKDLLILDETLRRVDKPDLIVFTANRSAFSAIIPHTLAQNNPEDAFRLKQEYNLSTISLDGVTESPWIATHNFFAERSDIVAWLMNQAYSVTWAQSKVDYPEQRSYLGHPYLGMVGWRNTRPGVLDAMVSLAAQYKLPLLLVTVPMNYASPFSQWMQGQAQKFDIPLLDCSSLLPPKYFTDTYLHLNLDGHQRFAKMVSVWLQLWLIDPKLRGQTVTYCPSWEM
jgi:hypothetical protein